MLLLDPRQNKDCFEKEKNGEETLENALHKTIN